MKHAEGQKALEHRRLQAGRWLLNGVSKIEVARRCEVSPTSVTRWSEQLEAHGLSALKAQRARGRPAGLSDGERAQRVRALKAGALAQGFATELWTLLQIGKLVEQRFGIRYSGAQVSRILKALGWSCQRPTGRAVQRDEAAIRDWKQKRWPALKKTPGKAAKRSSSLTSRD